MARAAKFTKDRAVYWPSEFIPLANMLKGVDEKGQQVAPPVFTFNTSLMVLAASIGVREKRKREVGKERQEINTSTFASQNLDAYLFLIPLLGNQPLGVEMLRPEHEEELIREFERYAAGGLEVLRGLFDASAGKSSEVILQQEMLRILNKEEQVGSAELPNLFG